MRLMERIVAVLDPLKVAKKNGMRVGKGVTLMSRRGSSFGSEPYLITIEDEVRLSGGAFYNT